MKKRRKRKRERNEQPLLSLTRDYLPYRTNVLLIRRTSKFLLTAFHELAESVDDGAIFDEERRRLSETSNMLSGIKRGHLRSRMPWVASELLV